MYEQLDLFEASEKNQTPSNNEKEDKKSELTPRQWELYRLIYHNSMVEHRKTTQKEIIEKIQGYEWSESNNTSDHCSTIWSDVAANNLSFEHDKVIITNKYVYWIGSKRETEKFLLKLWADLSPRLTRYWKYVKKVGYDGQGRLYDKNLNPLDGDSNSRLFHESFNNYDVELQVCVDAMREEEKLERKKEKQDSKILNKNEDKEN